MVGPNDPGREHHGAESLKAEVVGSLSTEQEEIATRPLSLVLGNGDTTRVI